MRRERFRPTVRAVVAALAALTSATIPAGVPVHLGAQVGKSVTIVDANIASEKELTGLPHLTPALVKSVIGARPFPSITELDALLGALARRRRNGPSSTDGSSCT